MDPEANMKNMSRRIIIDRFDTTEHLRGRARTYANVKAAALAAGRFSVFEATSNAKNAALFTDLENDPEVETFRDPPGFPWIGVRRRKQA
jgi:hypothetical protein